MIGTDELDRAYRAIEGTVHRTPLMSASSLGRSAGVELHLKLELFQKTGSFKIRGALNRLSRMAEEERRAGIITVSAGNHAQSVAFAAARFGTRCTVVMPADAARSKIDAAVGYGAEVILHEDLASIFDRLREEQQRTGATFLHPFDDPLVIAGAGTVGSEILEQLPDTASVVVPVGGGGLLSGIAVAVRSRRPEAKIYGVEPEGAPTMTRALEAGRPVTLGSLSTIADGLAPPFVGETNLEIVSRMVDGVVLVSDDEIRSAMRRLLARAKVMAEPSGAASTAAILNGRLPALPSPVVAVVSGGNIDLPRLKEIL